MKDSVLVYVGGYFASMSFCYDRDGERFCLYTLATREPDDTNLNAMRYMGGKDKKLFHYYNCSRNKFFALDRMVINFVLFH